MTPTLFGRWHTRLLLFFFIGLPVTFLWGMYKEDWPWPPPTDLDKIFVQQFMVLLLILILGLVLDVLYIQIQRFHWDQDWPFAYQFFFSYVEFFIIYGLIYFELLDFLFTPIPPLSAALCHFTLVFVPSFLALLGGIQIFMVRWRFKGGEFGRMPLR